jgi:chromosome segregation ATPase
MWGEWLEKGKELASKAQAAALELDKQINQSVGITDAPALTSELIAEDDDDILNDAWGGDNDDLAALDDEFDEKVTAQESVEEDSDKGATVHASETPVSDHLAQNDDGEQVDDLADSNDLAEIHATIDDVLEKDEGATDEGLPIKKNDENESTGGGAISSFAPVESTITGTGIDLHGPVENAGDEPKDHSETVHDDVIHQEEGWGTGNDDLDLIDTSENAFTSDHPLEEGGEIVTPSEMPDSNTAVATHAEATVVDSSILAETEYEQNDIPTSTSDDQPDTEVTEQITLQEKSQTEGDSPPPLDGSRKDGDHAQNVHVLEAQIEELNNLLRQREEQLMNKTEQLTEMTSMFESEKQQLLQKVANTKEEAMRRTQKAKERVEAMEARLKELARQSTAGDQDAAKQAEIIAALREEGEKLAHKQAEMEKAVRTAKGEARSLREELEDERTAKDNALEKIVSLESELKKTKDDLSSARRGESHAEKLDAELRHLTEENNTKAATILLLEQQVNELKENMKSQEAALHEIQQGASIESEREVKKIRKEHNDAISDLETKLHTTEREAGIREDALRHEIAELRKRWQDSVRRADALSMDIQSSTAPLLRQIESAERQSRSRAAAWAELESSLRSQLEEAVISNEQLLKEKGDLKTRNSRAERAVKEYETELKSLNIKLDDQIEMNRELQVRANDLEIQNAKLKEEYSEVQRLANEGASKVRSEMSQTVIESEERHRAQIESIRRELGQEREKRSLLEKQVEELLDKAGMIIPPQLTLSSHIPESQPARLRQSDNQFDILNEALGGLGSDEEDEDTEDQAMNQQGDAHGSFAALAELTSRLKAAKIELDVLKKQLVEAQSARDRMAIELNETRGAKEKLPLFEKRVQELTRENEEMAIEIQSLQEDIAEVKEMYRTQLNVLLEEKAPRNGDNVEVIESAVCSNETENLQLEDESKI